MKCIGIDVSSKKLNIYRNDTKESFEIENTQNALEKFEKQKKLESDEYVIGVESTGRYHFVCQEYFVMKGYEFRCLNPLLTNKVIFATVRKKKTDKSDAEVIAFLLNLGEGQKVTKEQLRTTKRTILRTRKKLVHQKTVLKLLLQELGKEHQNKGITETKASLQRVLITIEDEIKVLEKEAMGVSETKAEKLIRSIPGFATQLAGVVATEVGDFTRFSAATQFKAYVGIDPKVSQSGATHYTGKITKRGNPYLRCAFYLAAQVARQHDPELKAFYEKKIGEGKNFRVAICAVARKLCERVYAVVMRGVPYQIRELSFS
ncbi:IS110 family transposase [Candidatus Peregrinibacteria bacterium]|nr:IS110 family transposase [Candidatus Peregrinibacteria bacterium]